MSVFYLIFSQVITKIVTFAMNQILLQNMSPQIFGMMAYFDFVIGSILFFSREAQRISNQRVARGPDALAKISSFLYMPLALALPIAAVFWGLQRKSEVFRNIVLQADTFFKAAPVLVGLVVIELLSEPFFAVNQYNLGFRVRSKVESSAVLAKCASFLACFLLLKLNTASNNAMGPALLAYAVGQMAYALAVYAGYALHFRQIFPTRAMQSRSLTEEHDGAKVKTQLPESTETSGRKETADAAPHSLFFDRELFTIWKTLFIQMIFKHLLTEGDTLILSSLFSISQQGVYSVIANYGSIIARLLFQPIEESVRIVTASKLGQNERRSSISNMENHLVFYWNLSLLIVLGGYANGAFMLRVLIGRNPLWMQSPVFDHFSQYMIYLPFLAFNGILEAFYSSASTPSQMSRFSLYLSATSGIYFALLVLFISKWHLGILGLILCNILNMSLRIAYCGCFWWRFSGAKWTRGALRSVLVPLGLFAGSFLAQVWRFNGKSKTLRDFLESAVICACVLVLMVLNERSRLKRVINKTIKED